MNRRWLIPMLLVGLVGACGDDDGADPIDAAATDGQVDDGQVADAEVDAGALTCDQTGVVPTCGTGGATGQVLGNYEGRDYALYVPASYREDAAMPIVVALYGLGDDFQNYYLTLDYVGWTDVAADQGFILFVPESTNPTRPSFLHLTSSSQLDSAATQAELLSVLEAVYYGVGADYNLETTRIYVTGFSEGGVCTELFGLWYHQLIHALAPYGGVVSSKPLDPAMRKIPVYLVCGTLDNAYSYATVSAQDWTANGHPVEHAWVSGVGHSMVDLNTTGPGFDEVYGWMSTVAAEPVSSAYNPP